MDWASKNNRKKGYQQPKTHGRTVRLWNVGWSTLKVTYNHLSKECIFFPPILLSCADAARKDWGWECRRGTLDPCPKRIGKNAFSISDIQNSIFEHVVNIKINDVVYIFSVLCLQKSRRIPAYNTSGVLGQNPGSEGQESVLLISFRGNSYDRAHLRITVITRNLLLLYALPPGLWVFPFG